AAPRAAAPTSARSNVVPIGGRLGGAAASALDDDLEVDEPTRVGSVDMAELEAKAFAAERESSKKAEEAKADLFPDVKRPPTGKTSTRDPGLAPPPKPAARPDTGKNALPLVAAKPIAKPAPKPAPEIVDEPDLPFDEPSFADVPAPPAAVAPAPAFVSAPLPVAPAPIAAAPVASVAPREEEKRRGGGIPIPALIAIAGATAFGGVMAYMLGTHFLGPTPTAPAIATVQPTTAPPPTTTTAPPPTAAIETAPETPPATTEVTPETPPTTTTAPPATTTGGHTVRPHAGGTGTAGSTTTGTASGGAQSATKAPTGRFAEFADDGEGPAQIATSGRTSIADEPGGGSSGGNTRGQQELTADQIRAVITRERPAVNRCWESELRRLGQAATVRLDVDLTIGGSGTVTSVTTRGQSVGTLADCIERNVRRWRFPPVNGSTQTSFPLVFSGTE
ncbi:MAG: AgmX/PglI C-terminal domain-containing protein, partial [Deltaproteobacteria bacterium]|nr:AgmX/PglI C-terminal domain-containing protein [Deltaproteobacteria bacterium]